MIRRPPNGLLQIIILRILYVGLPCTNIKCPIPNRYPNMVQPSRGNLSKIVFSDECRPMLL